MKWIVVALAVLPGPMAQAGEEGTPTCRELLAETLSFMEQRPVLKEELATGLMWMRQDAQAAQAAGDEARCVTLLIQVKELLT